MKKAIDNIVLVIFSLAISAAFTLVIWGVFLGNLYASLFLGQIESQSNYLVVLILSTYIPIILPIAIFVLNFILLMKLTRKFPALVIGGVLILVFGWFFIFKPNKIIGGDVGPYKKGETVLARFKFTPIKLHDVVIFNRPGDWVGYVVGLPGESIDEAYYLTQQKFEGDVIPEGYCAITIGEAKYVWLIMKDQIKYVVWYPFR